VFISIVQIKDQLHEENTNVRHFDLGGGRREELQENGQQVLGNAGKWQTP
jgi:hypothetical protein